MAKYKPPKFPAVNAAVRALYKRLKVAFYTLCILDRRIEPNGEFTNYLYDEIFAIVDAIYKAGWEDCNFYITHEFKREIRFSLYCYKKKRTIKDCWQLFLYDSRLGR